MAHGEGRKVAGLVGALALMVGGCNCEDELILVEHDGAGQTDTRAQLAPCEDSDGDGFGHGAGCLGPDCDDSDAQLGEDGARPCYGGPEGTLGVGACVAGVESCAAGMLLGCAGEVLPAEESCNAVDDDCDGQTDEALARSCYSGPEGTEGVAGCAAGTATCAAGAWGECLGEMLPSVEECNGVDDDCDGQVDQGVERICYTGPAGTEGVGRCGAGSQSCADGVWGACQDETLPRDELCDGEDDDCDGLVDEALARLCYDGPAGTAGLGLCRPGSSVCSVGGWLACEGQVLPSQEVCDGLDNDCDGLVDENLARACYGGPAGTEGVGVCVVGAQSCAEGSWGVCVGVRLPSNEVCDGADNDCDGQTDEALSRGCYDGPAGTQGVGLCAGGTQGCVAGAWGECEGQRLPAPESCDGADEDCDGTVDESLSRSCYDGPAETNGVGLCARGTQSCEAGAWGSCAGQRLPAAEECDAADNDCDGAVDESLARACYTGPAGTAGTGACASGVQSCTLGEWGDCGGQVLPAAERCDGRDEDCDGAVDESLTRACYDGPAGTAGLGACRAGAQSCESGLWGECEAQVLPALEVCDGVDNDCDRGVDEGLAQACYTGPEGTEGIGICHAGSSGCAGGSFGECRGQVLPGVETCNGLDDDCDGQVDEGLVQACYGGPAGTEGVGSCVAGQATCVSGQWQGCAGQVLPAPESCDGRDEDCDGQVDEGLARACYSGLPGTQGIGLCAAGVERCQAGTWGTCSGERVPQPEECDGLDNDCDGWVDESLARGCYDGPAGTDGVGSCRGGVATCVVGQWQGCTGQQLPALESCDGQDNDCDGAVDEELARGCYDGPPGTDGRGACRSGVQRCDAGLWGSCQGQVVPAAESCDGTDEDCDGSIDEELVQACYGGAVGTQGVGLCRGGSQACANGSWGACLGEQVPAAEVCDGLDNDCDGSADESVTRACYSGAEGTMGVGACRGGLETCLAGSWGSCQGQVVPAAEVCDGIDQDCDGAADEALVRACYDGPAGSAGVGSCHRGTQSCAAGSWGECGGQALPTLEICNAQDDDCDGLTDEDVSRGCYSGAAETLGVGLCRGGTQNCAAGGWSGCSGEIVPAGELCDGYDNDCDGHADESLARACYSGPAGTEDVGVCAAGVQSCTSGVWGGCVGATLPTVESCDGRDEDCDGAVDDGVTRACYSGSPESAGIGTCRAGVSTCVQGSFGSCVGEVLPAAESCDGRDEDCDGAVDDAITRSCYSGTSGSAGTGLCQAGLESCSAGAWSSCAGEVLPASETCDGADNDCDGQQDENVTLYTQDGSGQSVNPVYRPVDIVFVVDNSQSMTNEIVAVENNINGSFAAIMDQSGLDYRVIMLSKHGSATYNQSICIRPPLGGNTSCSTSCPTNGPRFFQYSTEIGSSDSLYRIISTYRTSDACGLAPGGWYQWLRSGAARVFIEITDDGPYSGDYYAYNRMTADSFEAQLFALNPQEFGSASARDYVFHSIVGLDESSPVTAAWPATSPLVYGTCYGDVRQNGLEYQKLSQRTGGLRYPICQYQSFDAVFREVALGIIESTEMECDFQISSVPADSAMENTLLDLVPSNGGGRVGLTHVANAAACTGNAFYTEGTVIKLCPEACTLWRDDPLAQIEVRFTCQQTIR